MLAIACFKQYTALSLSSTSTVRPLLEKLLVVGWRWRRWRTILSATTRELRVPKGFCQSSASLLTTFYLPSSSGWFNPSIPCRCRVGSFIQLLQSLPTVKLRWMDGQSGWAKGEVSLFGLGKLGLPVPVRCAVCVGERTWARGKRMKVEAPSISDVCNNL